MAPNQGPSPLVKDCGKNVARAEKLRPEYAPPDVVPEGLIRVENKLYSVEELAKMHPGGPVFVRSFSGRDATLPFIMYHRRMFPHSSVKKALKGTDDNIDSYLAEDIVDYMELNERVSKVLPRLQSFAPWYFYLKAALILGSFVGVEGYMHYNAYYGFPFNIIYGILIALMALNLQHDGNHGALSRRPWVNRALGYSLNLYGGSSLQWMFNHNLLHHIYTNDKHLDPDSIYLNSLLYLTNPLRRSKLMRFSFFCHFVYPILTVMLHAVNFLKLYTFWTVAALVGSVRFGFLYSTVNWIKGTYEGQANHIAKDDRIFDTITQFLAIFRILIFPVINTGSIYGFLNGMIVIAAGNFYVNAVIILGHHYVGVEKGDLSKPGTKGSKEDSFIYKQVSTTCNSGGSWLCQLHGGANYQIEHHLFPRVHHGHYPKIAPIVKQFCKEKGIPYTHFPNMKQNLSSAMSHYFNLESK